MTTKLCAVAVLALGVGGLVGTPTAQAQTRGQWVKVSLGVVVERDSSNYVYFQGRTVARGQVVTGIPVSGVRQRWTNSQRATEWVTLRPGTTEVAVDRRYANQNRMLAFHCYRWEWRR